MNLFNISAGLLESAKKIINDSSSADANRLGLIATSKSSLAMSKGTKTKHRAANQACNDAARAHAEAEKDNIGNNLEHDHRVEKERFDRLANIHYKQSIG